MQTTCRKEAVNWTTTSPSRPPGQENSRPNARPRQQVDGQEGRTPARGSLTERQVAAGDRAWATAEHEQNPQTQDTATHAQAPRPSAYAAWGGTSRAPGPKCLHQGRFHRGIGDNKTQQQAIHPDTQIKSVSDGAGWGTWHYTKANIVSPFGGFWVVTAVACTRPSKEGAPWYAPKKLFLLEFSCFFSPGICLSLP